MWRYGTSGPQLELDDIQGDIVVGLQKDFEWFVFFTIDDAARFKELARRTLLSRISSTAQVLKQEHELQAHKESGRNGKLPLFGLNIGFTSEGLKKLEVSGLDEITDNAFVEGLASRSTDVLSDPGQGPYSANQWNVGGHNNTPDGVMLITGPEQTSVDEIKEELTGLAAAAGCRVTYAECGMTLPTVVTNILAFWTEFQTQRSSTSSYQQAVIYGPANSFSDIHHRTPMTRIIQGNWPRADLNGPETDR